jgi:hypothetical protein
MRERNGVRVGEPVRDLDGTPLGRVTQLYPWGFQVRRLLRRGVVARYDEVRGVRDGALVLARSRRDLFDLAAGELPRSWRVPAPPGFPTAATPAEAQALREDLARGALGGPSAPPAGAPPREETPPSREEERVAAGTRGQSIAAPPPDA